MQLKKTYAKYRCKRSAFRSSRKSKIRLFCKMAYSAHYSYVWLEGSAGESRNRKWNKIRRALGQQQLNQLSAFRWFPIPCIFTARETFVYAIILKWRSLPEVHLTHLGSNHARKVRNHSVLLLAFLSLVPAVASTFPIWRNLKFQRLCGKVGNY